jgi:nitroreductase
MSLLMKRKSIREYLDKPVEDDKIKALLTSAMQAPSANNQQPWEFVVVKDKDTLIKLSTVSRGAWMLANAPLCITVIIKQDGKSPVMAPQDCAASVQNILLEAVHQGLGAVWIGVYPIEERTTRVNEILGIKQHTAFANIAIGYPAKPTEITKRFDPLRIHYEKVT